MTILPLLIGIGLFWVIVLILNRRYELKKRGITQMFKLEPNV